MSEPESGEAPVELDVYEFKGPGVALAMYNIDQVCLFSSPGKGVIVSCLTNGSVKFASLFEHLLNPQCHWRFQRNGPFT